MIWSISIQNGQESHRFEAYTKEVYEDPDAIHHWETNEVLWNNVVYLKEGIEVNRKF